LEQEVVSKDFTISTVDYPNVQFECETDNSDIHLSELSRSTDDGETRILFRLTVHNAAGLRTSSLIDLIPINVDLPKLTIPVYFHHLLGEQKQYLATSQINLGGIKRDENTAVKVYGDRTFLHNVHKVQALSKDDVVTVVSYAVPTADADFLEIILKIAGDYLKDHELIRGSLALFSSDDNVATIQASGIVVSE